MKLKTAIWLTSTCVVLGGSASAHAGPTIRDLVGVTDIVDVSISPDGRLVAFREDQASIETNTYRSSWHVAPVSAEDDARRLSDGGEPIRGFAGEAIAEPPVWSPDNQFIYYRAEFGGQVEVWRARVDGSLVQQVTHDAGDVETLLLSADGRRLIYKVGATREHIAQAEESEYDRGILVDSSVPVGQGLFRSAIVNGRLQTQRYSGPWVSRGGLANSAFEWKGVDLATLDVTSASPADEAVIAATPGNRLGVKATALSFPIEVADGRVAYLSGLGSAPLIHLSDPSGRQNDKICQADACRDQGLDYLSSRPGRAEVIFTVSDAERGYAQTLYAWNYQSGAVRKLVAAEGRIGGGRPASGGETCATSERYAACVTEAADQPPRLERVDLETGDRRVLADPNASLAAAVKGRVRFMTWHDDNGQRFTGQFYPAQHVSEGKRSPLFLDYYYCAGFVRGGVGDEWPFLVLADQGIASLCINKVSGKDALDEYRIATDGVRAAVANLAAVRQVDPTRVGMGGLSFGSEVTMWIVDHTTLLRAASITSSSITPTYYWFHSLQPGFAAILQQRWRLGAPKDVDPQWEAVSPTLRIDKINTPLLMQMPEQEYLQTMEWYGRLVTAGKPVELYAFPNEPHQKFLPRHKVAAYQRNLEWFQFWLSDDTSGLPLDDGQYIRWANLKVKAGQKKGP